jgi:hypothetical protein
MGLDTYKHNCQAASNNPSPATFWSLHFIHYTVIRICVNSVLMSHLYVRVFLFAAFKAIISISEPQKANVTIVKLVDM